MYKIVKPIKQHVHSGDVMCSSSYCVSYSYTVRACLIVTVHGSISCTDPLRPARRSTYHMKVSKPLTKIQKERDMNLQPYFKMTSNQLINSSV